MLKNCVVVIFVIYCTINFLKAQNPNAISFDEIMQAYETIRSMNLDSQAVLEIDTFVLKKDVGEFTLINGTVYFFKPVHEQVVGAFFDGLGMFRIDTEDRIEKQQLNWFTGSECGEMEFEQVMFLFTDNTYDQITVAGKPATGSIDHNLLDDIQAFREELRERFFENVDGSVLADIITNQFNGYFRAYLECSDDHFIFSVDPFASEEVVLVRYATERFQKRSSFEIWYSARAQNSRLRTDRLFDLKQIDLDVRIDNKEMLDATAQLTFVNYVEGLQFVPLILAPQLRVNEVLINKKDTCLYIQEDKDKDAELWVYFPEPLSKDKTYDLVLKYSGKDIVEDIGGGNYVVSYRQSWFPTFYDKIYDPAQFRITYAIPKNTTLLSTGKHVRQWDEADMTMSEWKSNGEYRFAGFNYGKFSKQTEKSDLCQIDCFTNQYLYDAFYELQKLLEKYKELQVELMLLPQELTTDKMGKNAAIESRNAYEVYVHFYGTIPFQHIMVSQQPYLTLGQSWPGLIYLPFTAFMRQTVIERLIEPTLGLPAVQRIEAYHEGLAPHEIAHQWWGHTIMTASYRDQWLEEGFATYSEALHAQVAEGTKAFKELMHKEREYILRKGEEGIRLTDLGPICLGFRLSSLTNPHGLSLIYSKGAFVLHMIRMMLFDYNKRNDDRFISMMKDFVREYSGKTVTTRDFQRIVEKHMGCSMTWFFDQWVYGTEIPVYTIEYTAQSSEDGGYLLTVQAQQSSVQKSFKMPLPILVNFENGYAVVTMEITGDEPVAKQFKLPGKPKSIEANPWSAVLCEIK